MIENQENQKQVLPRTFKAIALGLEAEISAAHTVRFRWFTENGPRTEFMLDPDEDYKAFGITEATRDRIKAEMAEFRAEAEANNEVSEAEQIV